MIMFCFGLFYQSLFCCSPSFPSLMGADDYTPDSFASCCSPLSWSSTTLFCELIHPSDCHNNFVYTNHVDMCVCCCRIGRYFRRMGKQSFCSLPIINPSSFILIDEWQWVDGNIFWTSCPEWDLYFKLLNSHEIVCRHSSSVEDEFYWIADKCHFI